MTVDRFLCYVTIFTSVISMIFERSFSDLLWLTLYLPDQIFNSLYCQPYNSYSVSSENLVLDQLIIPKLILFSILVTYLVDIVLVL